MAIEAGHQRVLHTALLVGKTDPFVELTASARAIQVARIAPLFLKGDDAAGRQLSNIFGRDTFAGLRQKALGGDRVSRLLGEDIGVGMAMAVQEKVSASPDDDPLRLAIARDDYKEVERLLGVGKVGGLKGLGEELGRVVITNRKVEALLRTMNNHISKNTGRLSRRKEEQIDGLLVRLYEDPDVPPREIAWVQQYLFWAMEEEDGAAAGGNLDAGLVAQLASLLRGGGEREMMESTFDTFVNAELLQMAITLQLDTFPPGWFKHPPERFLQKPERNSVADWQQLIRARVCLANAAYIKAKVAAMDGEKAKGNDWLNLTERELRLIYEEPGVKWAMESIMDDFFERDSSDTRAYFLALRKKNFGEEGEIEWKDVLASFREYQEGLIGKLEEMGMEPLEAKAAVAMAWNFLYVSNAVESADNYRDIPGNCANVFGEQVRSMMHPMAKAKRKFGVAPDLDEKSKAQGTEEGWGGPLGAWFAEMLMWTDIRPDIIKGLNEGTFKPFPDRIGASMLEMLGVKVLKGGAGVAKMSLAQALLEKKEVVFEGSDSNLFGDYCDKWDTWYRYYLTAVGKSRLDVKTFSEWTSTLPDIFAKLATMKTVNDEQRMFADLTGANAISWMIANSVGLERSPKLMLVCPVPNYDAFVDSILQSPRLVSDGKVRNEIRERLHAGMQHLVTRARIKADAMMRNRGVTTT